MSKRNVILILLTLILVAGPILLWKHIPATPRITESGAEEAQYIGISTETNGPLTLTDRNNIFWTSESGEGGVYYSTVPVYFPSLLRVGKGFAFPDRDSIILVDQDLHEKRRFPVSGLGTGTQSASANSPNYMHGVFLFNTGDSTSSNSRKVVAVGSGGARSIDRENYLSALTACNNGTIKWIEFLPWNKEAIDGKGVAQIVTWTPDGEIETSDIIWDFQYEPGHENQLACDSSSHIIISEDNDGKPVSLLLKSLGEKTEVESKVDLPEIPPPAMARFSKVIQGTLYSLDKDNVLTAVDIRTGSIKYRETLDVKGPSPVSVTFDKDIAYLVVRPDHFENKQAVLPVDLKNPQCVGEVVPLMGYDEISQKSRLERLGNSFMVATSVLPIDVDRKPICR